MLAIYASHAIGPLLVGQLLEATKIVGCNDELIVQSFRCVLPLGIDKRIVSYLLKRAFSLCIELAKIVCRFIENAYDWKLLD